MLPGKEESVGKDTTPNTTGRTAIAVDLAKSVFEVAVSDRPGRVGDRHRLSRSALLPFFATRPPATVLLEACGTAHFWARELERLGHRVRLLPAQHVRRYRQGNKTDRADAQGAARGFPQRGDPPGAGQEPGAAGADGPASAARRVARHSNCADQYPARPAARAGHRPSGRSAARLSRRPSSSPVTPRASWATRCASRRSSSSRRSASSSGASATSSAGSKPSVDSTRSSAACARSPASAC